MSEQPSLRWTDWTGNEHFTEEEVRKWLRLSGEGFALWCGSAVRDVRHWEIGEDDYHQWSPISVTSRNRRGTNGRRYFRFSAEAIDCAKRAVIREWKRQQRNSEREKLP